mgnify:CR=1 FL=1
MIVDFSSSTIPPEDALVLVPDMSATCVPVPVVKISMKKGVALCVLFHYAFVKLSLSTKVRV